MPVTKAQHVAHTNMIAKVAKFFGPRPAAAQGSPIKTYSTIPGVGSPMSQMAKPPAQKPFVSSLPNLSQGQSYGTPLKTK